MKEESKDLQINQTWVLVVRPKHDNVVGSLQKIWTIATLNFRD